MLPFSLLLFREFEGLDGPRFGIYSSLPSLGGFRPIDLIVLFAGAIALLTRTTQRHSEPSRIPRPILLSLGAFGIAVGISIVHGVSKGGTELFFDWRNAFLGVVAAIAALATFRSARAALLGAYVLLLVLGGKSVFLLFRFLSGLSPVRAFSGHTIPTFDGPTLQATVLAALLALSLLCHVSRQPRAARALTIITLLSSSMLVLVSMRRTYWGQLGIGLAILLMGIPGRVRIRLGLITAAGALIALTMLDPNALIGRLQSLLVFSDSKSPYASTNDDHVNDLLDAWDVALENPVLGKGLGVQYETERIQGWKSASWGVHNGPLHVWVGYGLLGLISYMTFHVYLFGWLYRRGRESTEGPARGIAYGVFAAWVGSFTMSLGFSPWPYGALQNAMLLGICFTLVAACSSGGGIRQHRQSRCHQVRT
jgi:O-antigen ligase